MYDQWDWSQLSTVAWNTDPALICKAHQHGAKVVANAELPANRSLLESTSFRAGWVRLQLWTPLKALYTRNSLASDFCAHCEPRNSPFVVASYSLRPLCVRLGAAALQVQARLDEAAKARTDGINFDMEDPAGPGSPLARAYTALVAETAAAFHARDPDSQVCSKTYCRA